MVRETKTPEGAGYICEACGYQYPTKELAERCQEWCTEHHSCNLEITAQGTPPAQV